MTKGVRVGYAEYLIDGTIIHHAACWACQLRQCPGGLHTWADADDVEHASDTGQPDPSGQKCGCVCADGPVLRLLPEPDDYESLDAAPCPVCGSDAACGYDAEGRPMIHTIIDEDGGE